MKAMKNEAIVLQHRPFRFEIDIASLEKNYRWDEIKPQVDM